MFLRIPKVLTTSEIKEISQYLSKGNFTEGKATAGKVASRVKNNLQLSKQAKGRAEYDRLIINAIQKHDIIQKFAFPRYIFGPIFNMYKIGMEYGNHVDNPIMNIGQPRRTDLSITVFLNDASEYEGGELSIGTMSGFVQVKLDSGDAIIYPSSNIHRVEPVTRGVRIAAIAWMQSYIQDINKREILYELGKVCDSFELSSINNEISMLLTKNYYNLIRMWTES